MEPIATRAPYASGLHVRIELSPGNSPFCVQGCVTASACRRHHVPTSATDASIARPPMSPTRKHPRDLQTIFTSIQGLVSSPFSAEGKMERALIVIQMF